MGFCNKEKTPIEDSKPNTNGEMTSVTKYEINSNDSNEKLIYSINKISDKLEKILENNGVKKDYSFELLQFLKSEKEEKQGIIKQLQDQILTLYEENSDIKDIYNAKIKDLTVKVSDEQNKNKLLEKENNNLSSKLQTMDSLKEELLKAKSSLTSVNNELESATNKLEEKKLIEEQLNDYKLKLSELVHKNESLEVLNNESKENLSKEIQRNQELNSILEKSNIQISTAESEVKKLQNDFSFQLGEMDKLKSELSYYEKNDFTALKDAYDLFTNFSIRTKENMQAIFQTNTFLGFISNALQWDRIAAIWEQVKRKIVKNDMEDCKELRRLFLILFKIFNSGYTTPLYKLIIPDVGSRYNSNNMVIVNDKSDGVVKEVLLEGYMYIETNKVHDALVLVD